MRGVDDKTQGILFPGVIQAPTKQCTGCGEKVQNATRDEEGRWWCNAAGKTCELDFHYPEVP